MARAVPQAPAFVEGVINLRGRIIPVVDLRDRFGMREGELTKASRIVVADAGGTRLGLVVDGVSEVLMVPTDAIEPTPDVAVNADHVYLRAHLEFANGHMCGVWGVAQREGENFVYRQQQAPVAGERGSIITVASVEMATRKMT